MKKTFILCLTLFSFFFSQSQIRYLKGVLQASQQTPANSSIGSGVVIVKYNQSTKVLQLFGDYADLTAPITASHIHRGQPGVAGPVVVPLANTGEAAGALSGTATITQAIEDSLLAGNMYVNVHTPPPYDNGEIRAQLTLTTDAQTTFLSGRLQGAQQVPPNNSTAKGAVYTLLDNAKDSVFITGNFTGLSKAAMAAHVHQDPPGTATVNNIMFPIFFSPNTSGAVHVATGLTAAQTAIIKAGGSYVNVHTPDHPEGEIRAQLFNNSTVRYFTGELSGANQVPPVTTAARGTVIASYDAASKFLQLAGDYQKLSDTVTAAHIHPGAPGKNGAPLFPLTTSRDSTGTLVGAASLTQEQEDLLLAGNMYVNVHDSAYPDGEIRTQLLPTTSGETQIFATNLSPLQEVPAIKNSSAIGQALVLVDKVTGAIAVSGAFSGINSLVSKADIRLAPAGETGPVIFPLNAAYNSVHKSGTISGSGTLAASTIDSMINGFSYVNVYSRTLSTGAIRGQLGDLVLPVKLTSLNAVKQKNEVEVSWEIAEELNVSRYEVEQLNTTTNIWNTKGTVYSKNESIAATYSFNDVPNTYGSKYLVYRLKIIDKDGKFTYSYLVKVNFEKASPELFILTNPIVNGELKFNVTGLLTGKKAEISVIDLNGRLILRNTVSSLTNNTLKIPHLASGMYKLVVRIDDTMLQKSFIK